MALEIGEENGPQQMYSPMRVDKWSCGHVLCLFAERHGKADEGLRGFAAWLMDKHPHKRPPLLKWHESKTKVTIAVPKKRCLGTTGPPCLHNNSCAIFIRKTPDLLFVLFHAFITFFK